MSHSRFTAAAASGLRGRLLLSLAALGVAGAMAGLGTFADFTSTTSATNAIDSGVVTIALGAPGAANRLSVDATDIVPGDTIQRAFTLTNSGDQPLSSIVLATTASPNSVLTSDATLGLQMVIEKCSTGWNDGGTNPAYTYTCGGTRSYVVGDPVTLPVLGTYTLPGLTALAGPGTDNLLLTLTFPATTPNTAAGGASFQGVSSTVTYTFTGTQRAGTAH